jgi:puromycin-sensitive aminopeptidase
VAGPLLKIWVITQLKLEITLDLYRLPRNVVPTQYDLYLEPNLSTAKFVGHETITIQVNEPTREVVLNAVELTIESAEVQDSGGRTIVGKPNLVEETERCHISFPTELAKGTYKLKLAFHGILNDKLRGFYRSSYKVNGETHYCAVTQFEATDARRAFPCWDEPSFKAVFCTTLAVDAKLVAISNTSIAEEHIEGQKKRVHFSPTIKMSTYLVAFVVGNFEATEPKMIGKTPMRIWCIPGKKHLTEVALEIGSYSLRFYEEYYGRKYPGDKLDLIAIPDFSAGAMENLGAITFRETALLVDKAATTHSELERVAVVVSHENAHMWFGDLVTMSWWNGLWLNEAFATFMEILAVDSFKPSWKSWDSFGVSRTEAMLVDGLKSTRSIEFPVQAPRDADAMFDVLTYEKGAAVLRMLQQFVGEAVFQNGVRLYLERFAYANTETRDLWTALGEASHQPIPKVMEEWIFSPGYPIVSALQEGSVLKLSQQRFTYLKASGENQMWHVPVQVRVLSKGKEKVERVLMEGSGATINLPSDFQAAIVNEGGHGFYRVRYSGELLNAVVSQLKSLSSIERLNIVSDSWAAVRAGMMPITSYLDLTKQFEGERDRNVWAVILDSFHSINQIVEDADRPALERWVRSRVKSTFEELGWEVPSLAEDELRGQLRGDMIRAMALLGNDSTTQSHANEMYEKAVKNPNKTDANVLAAVIAILARTGDAARYETFLKNFRTAKTPQEEQRYLFSLAGFRSPELIQRTLASTINGDFRTQDAPFVMRSLLTSIHARYSAWKFLELNFSKMNTLYPLSGFRRMCQGLVGLAKPEWEREVLEFCTRNKVTLGGKVLEQILEQLKIAVSLKERESSNLHSYLG